MLNVIMVVAVVVAFVANIHYSNYDFALTLELSCPAVGSYLYFFFLFYFLQLGCIEISLHRDVFGKSKAFRLLGWLTSWLPC